MVFKPWTISVEAGVLGDLVWRPMNQKTAYRAWGATLRRRRRAERRERIASEGIDVSECKGWQSSLVNFISQAPLNSSAARPSLSFRLLRSSLYYFILARILPTQFSLNSPSSISGHLQYLIRCLTPQHPQVMSDHPGLPSARISLGSFCQKPPSPPMCPLGNFPFTDPPYPAVWL